MSRFHSRSGFTLAHFLILLELALIFFFCARPAVDYDYGWHVVNGWHVSDGLTLSGRDIYSWTATNLWIAHEWATEAAMGFLHDKLGPSGNSIAAAAIGCLAYVFVVVHLRARQVSLSATVMALPIVFVGAMRSVGVRPLMLELLFLAVLVAAIDAYLAGALGRRAALGLLVGGAVMWVNTHGSFLLLPAVLGITAVELFAGKDTRWRQFLAASVAACIASLANPWGIRIFEFATQSVSSAPTLAYIDEWKRPRLDEWLALPISDSGRACGARSWSDVAQSCICCDEARPAFDCRPSSRRGVRLPGIRFRQTRDAVRNCGSSDDCGRCSTVERVVESCSSLESPQSNRFEPADDQRRCRIVDRGYDRASVMASDFAGCSAARH